MENPYVFMHYMTEEEASIAPYYDEVRNKYGGVLPFVVDPHQLTKSECFDPHGKVRAELGDTYCYDCSAYKIVHDIHMGRLDAPAGSELQNFGLKRWVMVSTEKDKLVIDVVKKCDGSATATLLICGDVLATSFSHAYDLETGEVKETLRDV